MQNSARRGDRQAVLCTWHEYPRDQAFLKKFRPKKKMRRHSAGPPGHSCWTAIFSALGNPETADRRRSARPPPVRGRGGQVPSDLVVIADERNPPRAIIRRTTSGARICAAQNQSPTIPQSSGPPVRRFSRRRDRLPRACATASLVGQPPAAIDGTTGVTAPRRFLLGAKKKKKNQPRNSKALRAGSPAER